MSSRNFEPCRRHASSMTRPAPVRAGHPPTHAQFLPDDRLPRMSASKERGSGASDAWLCCIQGSPARDAPRRIRFSSAAPASDPTGHARGSARCAGYPTTTPGSHHRDASRWRPSLSRGEPSVPCADRAGIGTRIRLLAMVNFTRQRTRRSPTLVRTRSMRARWSMESKHASMSASNTHS